MQNKLRTSSFIITLILITIAFYVLIVPLADWLFGVVSMPPVRTPTQTPTIPSTVTPTSTPTVTATPNITATLSPTPTSDQALQVVLSWAQKAHLDLLVVEPSGEIIYWGNMTSDSGGQLDKDAGCGIDSPQSVQISWPRILTGTYRVRIYYYDDCASIGETNWQVEIRAGDEVITKQVGVIEEHQILEVLTFDGDTLQFDSEIKKLLDPLQK